MGKKIYFLLKNRLISVDKKVDNFYFKEQNSKL